MENMEPFLSVRMVVLVTGRLFSGWDVGYACGT